jgi:hypothetical protein
MIKHISKQVILIIMLFGLNSAISQPAINSISGNMIHKGTLTINGTGFGTKSPAAPRVVDWCDNSSTNNLDTFYSRDDDCTSSFYKGPPVGGGTIPNPGDTDCEVGYKPLPWKGFNSPDGRITKVIGTCHTTANGNWVGSQNADMFFTIPEWNSSTLFLMYWYCADPNYSNENNPAAGENWKELTPNGSESGHGGCYLDGIDGVTWGPCGGGCPNETYPNDVYYMGGSGPSCASGSRVFTHNPMIGWTHFEHIWDISGHYFYSTTGSGVVKGGWANVNIQGANPGNDPYSISIGGYNRFPRTSAVNNHRIWTGIYADDSFARVMLGNADTWTNCTIREVQIPQSWNSSSIECTINLGNFSESDTMYLFVFDENNNHNQTGFLIGQIGPKPPKNVDIVP